MEAGIHDQESDTLQAILAPAGTPREIVMLLHREIVAVLALPEIRTQFDKMGFETIANTPEEFTAMIRVEVAKWGKLIREANIKVE